VFRSPRLWVAVAALVTIPLLALVEPLERSGFDLRLRFRRSAGWPADLVLVPIDDAAIQAYGRWPWARKQTAQLLDAVRAAGATTIVFDGVFVGASDPESDAALERSLSNTVIAISGSVEPNQRPADDILRGALLPTEAPHGVMWDARAFVVPDARFALAAAGMGHTLSFPADDLVIRGHIPMLGVPGERGTLPSLALAGLRHQRKWAAADVRFENGDLHLPPGILRLENGEGYLDWVPGDPLPRRVRARELLAGEVPPGSLEGALALVYIDSNSVADRTLAPGRGVVPGGIVVATAIRTLDGRHAPRPIRVWHALAVTLAAILLAAGALSRLQTRTLVLVALGGPLAIFAIGSALVPAFDLFVPVAAPSLMLLVACAGLAIRADRLADAERRHLKDLLASARGLPEPSLAEDRATVALSGEPRESTLGQLASGGPLARPVQIGRYRVTRCLGRGGMGAIFLADDTELDRAVALKVLTAQEPIAYERFRREAQAVARVDHPNVVRIFEIGADAEVPFLVIEYVAGGSIVDWFRTYPPELSWPPPWTKSVGMIRDAAAGLGAVHAAGMVHRDVKPANILLTPEGVAKIADFGIAKLGGSNTLTREGSMVGTIGYLSPEQALGTEVDPRSDVYSLGVTWYRLITGRSAFDGTTAEILRRQVTTSPPDPRKVVPLLPASVADLVLRMTDVDRARRPEDGRALVREIDAVLANAETRSGST